MAVSAALKKILDELKAYANKDEVLNAIKDEPDYVDLKSTVYQPAFDDGHGTALAAHQSAKTRLETQLQQAKDAKVAAENALQQLKDNNPDSAKLHADYGQKIKDLEAQIERIKGEQLAERKQTLLDKVRDSVRDELKALRVDPDKAEAMADANLRNYQIGDDLSTRILQPGKSTAYAGDMKAQAKSLAAELFKTVPKTLILSNVPGGGSAAEGEATGADGEGGTKREILTKAAESAKNKFKTATNSQGQPVNPQEEVNRRLGVRART